MLALRTGRIIGQAAALVSAMMLSTLATAGVVKDQTVTINGQNFTADWYLPDNQAEGIVYLQHGFSRKSKHLRDMGNALMNAGLMVLSVNTDVSQGNSSLATSIAQGLVTNPPTPPNGLSFPGKLVLAGHSAWGAHVGYIGSAIASLDASLLKGVILFDPVEGPNLQPHLQAVVDTGSPVRAILATASSCNGFAGTHSDLQNLNTDYAGIRLIRRSRHIDVEGANTDFFMKLACGTPRSHNINYNRDFAVNWALDMITGSYTPAYYPGGAKVEQLYNNSDGRVID